MRMYKSLTALVFRDELFPEIQKLVLIQNEQMYKTDTKFKFTMVWSHPFSELFLQFLDPQSQAQLRQLLQLLPLLL
jgi:hypothetical protein